MKKSFKSDLKQGFFTALTVAPSLTVMLLSAVYYLSAGLSGYGWNGTPVLLGLLTLLALAASTVIGVLWKRTMAPALLAVLFWLCFISYFGVCISGSTDWFDDVFFQALTLIFSFPVFSYVPVLNVFGDYTAAATLLLTGLLAALNTGASVWLRERKGKRG